MGLKRNLISDEERGIIGIVRLNKLMSIRRINKKWECKWGGIAFDWRSKKNLWGRFGGGWDWEVGFQIGSSTIIFNLLICSLRIWIKTKEAKCFYHSNLKMILSVRQSSTWSARDFLNWSS